MRIAREPSLVLFELEGDTYTWKGVLLVIYAYVMSLFFATFAGPPLFQLVEWLSVHHAHPAWDYILAKGFYKFFDRLRYIPVLIAIPWSLYQLKLWPPSKLGLAWNRHGLRSFFKWSFVGIALLACILSIQAVLGEVRLQPNASIGTCMQWLLRGLAIGLVVSLLEEIIFRGLVTRVCYAAFAPFFAVVISALFFAWIHFRMPASMWQTANTDVAWASGLHAGYWTLFGIFPGFELLPFLNLLFVGIITGVLFIQTRSLMASIGFHFGVVFAMAVYKKAFEVHSGALSWLVGSKQVIDGLVPALMLAGISIYLLKRWAASHER